jgi:hypothetical protein
VPWSVSYNITYQWPISISAICFWCTGSAFNFKYTFTYCSYRHFRCQWYDVPEMAVTASAVSSSVYLQRMQEATSFATLVGLAYFRNTWFIFLGPGTKEPNGMLYDRNLLHCVSHWDCRNAFQAYWGWCDVKLYLSFHSSPPSDICQQTKNSCH